MITRVQSNNKSVTFGSLNASKGAQKLLTKAADFTSVQQRIALGVSALAFQPLIDLRNKDVDEDTRKVSAVRSAAKAIIGTTTGVIVRGGTILLGAMLFAKRDAAGKIIKEVAQNGKKSSYVLDPDKIKKICGDGFKNLDEDAIKRIPSVVGTIAALGVMLFSNFLVDAPLTNAVMGKINEVMDKHFSKKRAESQNAKEAPSV